MISSRGLPLIRSLSTTSASLNRGTAPLSAVLHAKHSSHWVEYTICRNATLPTAINTTILRDLSGLMVVDNDENINDTTHQRGKVLGMITSRDLLRQINLANEGAEETDDVTVESFMTPLSQLVFARPEETVAKATEVMGHTGRVMLPVISTEGRVSGIVTARDFLTFGLDAKKRGGKKAFLEDMVERTGAEMGSMEEAPDYLKFEPTNLPLFCNVGTAALPHPFKTADGVAGNLRAHGPSDFTNDPELSEDASFVYKYGVEAGITFAGVADGVGSWRQYGVDPRLFSRALMSNSLDILQNMPVERVDGSQAHIKPTEILKMAHERVIKENVIGSSTATVMAFDNANHSITFSNLGDSGIIVLRHIDSDVAGSLKRDRETLRDNRLGDLRVTFVSQQQLKSFNHPYQFGWTGETEEIVDAKSSLKTFKDACTSSIHVRRGDIVVMATDGLFDNVDIDEIQSVCLDWEQEYGFIKDGGVKAREKRWAKGGSLSEESKSGVQDLAQRLVQKARERSVDNSVDSPFAILAKENDIMWSGGMPDDCTVIVCHVVGQQ